jgi:hypothetical protein
MAKHNKTVIAALKLIQETGRATQAVGEPLVKLGLIEVNTEDLDENGAAAARLTQKGIDGMPVDKNKNETSAGGFALIDGVVLPESKRGFGRAVGTSKYPFATMDIGKTFYVGNADVEGGDAVKKLTSTVSNMNNKYRTETGETETKTRTKRGDGNKAVLDEAGNKIKETVTVLAYKQDRKFTIRPAKAGEVYGAWTCPADGAIIQRTL